MTLHWMNRRMLGGVAVVAAIVAVGLWPQSIPVDVATVTRGPLVVTLDEDGRTRVHHAFVVSAPLAGRLERLELHPGDAVVKDVTVVARLRAEAPQLLDARTRAEASAAVEAARGTVGRAAAEEQRAKAALQLATAELTREEALASAGLTTPQSLETRRNAVVAARESVNATQYAVASATADLERARARLLPSTLDPDGRLVTVRSPVDGVVLRLFQESEGVVPAGARLLEIGDPSHVEIVADLLSTDAVKVKPGMPVRIEQWGGDAVLRARVERVEPAGFTKVSALGVEEQRVNVVIDVDDDRAVWSAMGDAFRVEVRIVIWEAADVLKVSTSALVRAGQEWIVFVVDGGRARPTRVETGQRTNLETEVTAGLAPGAIVVIHPPDTLTAGTRVEVTAP